MMIRSIAAGILAGVLIVVVSINLGLAGISLRASIKDKKSIVSDLSPNSRFEKVKEKKGEKFVQKGDVLYFSTDMSRDYEKARIKIRYKNKSNRDLFVGLQDRSGWHYKTELVDAPLLNNLGWYRMNEGNKGLYQKEKKYNSIAEFMEKKWEGPIGVYDYDKEIFNTKVSIEGYEARKEVSVTRTPLRGSQTIYFYVQDEPFDLTILKQDLNWYEGKDQMDVVVSKDGDIVFTATADDDGIEDSSKISRSPQVIEIHNPGPELPENGVYKVTISSSDDVIIKEIKSNLHKMVFESPIFPVNNHEIYPNATPKTEETTLYTEAPSIKMRTYHQETEQRVKVNNDEVEVGQSEISKETNSEEINKIVIPKSNVKLQVPYGYFALSAEGYFRPQSGFIIPIKSKEQLEYVDNIITNYQIPNKNNGWFEKEMTFDLSQAYVNNSKLSWIVHAPGLNKDQSEIEIENIEVELYKQGKIIKLK